MSSKPGQTYFDYFEMFYHLDLTVAKRRHFSRA